MFLTPHSRPFYILGQSKETVMVDLVSVAFISVDLAIYVKIGLVYSWCTLHVECSVKGI